MKNITDYTSVAADWRHQLKVNERRSYFVMLVFVLIYAAIGFLVDLYFLHPELDQVHILIALKALVTFKVTPIATIILGFVALFSILITFKFHDRLIMLGSKHNEITPKTARSLEETQLYNVIEELKIAAGLRYMPKVYLIEADYMNAFASGYSEKSALVAITRGLLNKLERSELQAVMAHELTHIRHGDIKLTLVASVLSNLILIVLDTMFRVSLFGGGRSRRRGSGGNAIFMVIFILRIVLPIVTMFLLFYLSRKREFMADAGAVELTRDNHPLAKALLKINTDHQMHKEQYAQLYGNTPHEEVRKEAYIFDPTQVGISVRQPFAKAFSTHPPMKDRLKALGFEMKK